MLKRILIGLCLISGSVITVLGQQRPLHTMYMFDPLLVNPAYAGNAVQLSATAMNRNQWVNFPGAPVTTTFTAHSGFFRSRVGVGIQLSSETIGIHQDFGLYGSYSFKIKFPQGSLSMGLQAGFNNLVSDFNKLNLRDAVDQNLAGRKVSFSPNFGAGIFYSYKRSYVGISVPYLINNRIIDVETIASVATQKRNYYILAGTSKDLSPSFKFLPSIMIRSQEGAPLSFDVSSLWVYKELVALGASYRLEDGIGMIFQLQINENFHVGYSYDFNTSDLAKYSNGTHEIMMNYRVKLGRIHKGLECPSYY